MATSTVTYVPRPMPTLGGDALYLQQELASVSQSIKTLNRALEDSKTLVASLQSNLDATNASLVTTQGSVTTLNGKVAAINNPQVLQFAPTSPSTSSWTGGQGYMQGWGSVAKITPTRSGKVLVMGLAWRLPAAAPTYIYGNIYFGTGTAPTALSTAAAGSTTDTSITVGAGAAVAGVYDLVSFKTVITGLTIGTQYWFDARLTSGSTTNMTCANDHIMLVEL